MVSDTFFCPPTFKESKNVKEFLRRFEPALVTSAREAIFLDDDSADGTTVLVRDIARCNSRDRWLRRVGRRGLSQLVSRGYVGLCSTYTCDNGCRLQRSDSLECLNLNASLRPV